MRIIDDGKKAVAELWGYDCDESADYRLIRYHVFKHCDKGLLLLNTVTGTLVLLDENEECLLNRLPCAYSNDMVPLIKARLLVPVEFDDARSVEQLRKICKKVFNDSSIRGYSILPTSACNARCFYCYESNVPHRTMTPEIADKTISYIIEHCGSKKQVGLNWFGGEPTLGEAIIDQICDGLLKKGIQFRSSMISNGYLFTKDMVQKAKTKWNLKNIQITLDGTEKIYNQTKAYIYKEGSPYKRVLNNIHLLLDHDVRVSVRMNLGFHNAHDLETLVDELTTLFSGKHNFYAYVHELFEDSGFEPVHHSESERRELVKLKLLLNERIRAGGCNNGGIFRRKNQLPSLKLSFCMATDPSSIQINPLGQFAKCDHQVFTKNIGNLDQGHDFSSEEAKFWLNAEYRDSCKVCPLFPCCGQITVCKATVPCLEDEIIQNLIDTREQMQCIYKTKPI